MISVSEIDKKIGIGVYSTSVPGIGGRIKEKPSDFIVQEITPAKEIASLEPNQQIPTETAEYTCFTLVKTDWNQDLLLKKIARRLGHSRKRFSAAGTKDKFAITSQRISAWKTSPEELAKIQIKDCKIGDFKAEAKKLELGDLWGNRFTVIVRDVNKKEAENVEKIMAELKKLGGLPNFFGEQRFGMRLNNSIIGKKLLQNDIEGAIKSFLTDTINAELEEGKQARKFLTENWGEFKQALKLYPRYMRFERAILDRLNKYPKDYVGAFKQLSKNTYKLFTHAYQAYLFNKILTQKIKDKESLDGAGNLIGYETVPNEVETELLEKENLEIKDFKVRAFPEASVKGQERKCIAELNILEYTFKGSNLELKFDLEKGAYATIFLREIQKA